MEKRIVAIGNSLGVVIDRALCKMLGLTKRTYVSVSTDGRRIVLEPVDKKPELTASEMIDVRAVVHELIHGRGIDPARIEALCPAFAGRYNFGRFLSWSETLGADATDRDRIYATRCRICVQQLEAGASWDDAIAAALREVPLDGATSAPVATAS